MDYGGLAKRLVLPPGFTPPRALAYEDIRATVLSRDDLDVSRDTALETDQAPT